jgi:hypothetical protein
VNATAAKAYRLIRLADGPDGTLGILESATNRALCYTLEEEGQQNRPNISRIPAGEYVCRRSRYHKGGYETFEITGVPGRSRILFHIGNTEEDTAGCPVLGRTVKVLRVQDEDTKAWRRKLAVGDSQSAFDRFMEELRGVDSFPLRIFEPGTAT